MGRWHFRLHTHPSTPIKPASQSVTLFSISLSTPDILNSYLINDAFLRINARSEVSYLGREDFFVLIFQSLKVCSRLNWISRFDRKRNSYARCAFFIQSIFGDQKNGFKQNKGGNLFSIIDLLLGAKFIALYFIWRVGDDFLQKFQIFTFLNFISFKFNFFHVITAP